MSSFFESFFNQGDDPPKTIHADGKKYFDISAEDMAFARAIDSIRSSSADLIEAALTVLEKEQTRQLQMIDAIRKDFLKYLVDKNGLSHTKSSNQIDFANRLLIHTPSDEVEKILESPEEDTSKPETET